MGVGAAALGGARGGGRARKVGGQSEPSGLRPTLATCVCGGQAGREGEVSDRRGQGAAGLVGGRSEQKARQAGHQQGAHEGARRDGGMEVRGSSAPRRGQGAPDAGSHTVEVWGPKAGG